MKKLILLFLITISVSVSAQIDKVEPPFWYENMTNNQVQIMFYGKNIAQNAVTVSLWHFVFVLPAFDISVAPAM